MKKFEVHHDHACWKHSIDKAGLRILVLHAGSYERRVTPAERQRNKRALDKAELLNQSVWPLDPLLKSKIIDLSSVPVWRRRP